MKTILKTISVQKKLQVCSCFMTFVMLFISIHNINYQTDYRINWLSQLLLIGLYFNSEKIVKDGSWLRLFFILFLSDYLMTYFSVLSFCFIRISLSDAIILALLFLSIFSILTFYLDKIEKHSCRLRD
ncbi:hypothetical protein AF59_02900 [Streptococcus uberis C5072]|nr:hypothetical protein AF59_02900 [Streptococcus uberis C5072]KKF55717.1 hypothetical protein AF66_02435 [Streptococcus uberis B190]KKF62685.1 hypothetical protein AF58_02820 [Streptococcus uberis C6344]